ncbi:response regulator [Geotalea sp. SG265]|uniref:response regulator n=1 Tax=Geotalea sp. SG265 TaxID=2922867 RepID=UPI001FAEBB45|nr:response regulator [Geotalea sp. SG265]
MKVLIVDDNAENLYLLQAILTGNGFSVAMAGNGEEALALLKQDSFGLIVSDILMPKMDGFQFCRAVRADITLRRIPFVFYTATYTSEEDEAFALGLGADRFILKPAAPQVFLQIIMDVVAHAKNKALQPGQANLGEEDYLVTYNSRLREKLDDKLVQIRESERRYRNLFNSLRDVVIITDLQGMVLDANQPALRTIFGYELEDLKGADSRLLFAGTAPVGHEAVNGVAIALEPLVREVACRKKDGSRFEGELSALKLIGDDGLPVGDIQVIRDISQQKMLEAQLQHAQKMEAVGRLAGGVAHDFNNKLTVIMGHLELLQHRRPQWEVVEETLQRVMKAAQQAREITRQLLAFSRKEIIVPRTVNLNELIEIGCKSLGCLIGEDIILDLALAPDLWPARLDPTQVDQIVMNLSVNARDAMPRGGTLRFATSNVLIDRHLSLQHSQAAPGKYVQLEISDTGCGMSAEILTHIFEPFFTTKEAGKGTGLGLATIYGIVSQNRGFIDVSSEPGCGTTFTICFPRWEKGPETGTAVPETASTRKKSSTVLLVEDDEAVRRVVKTMLETQGYQVFEMAGTEEAVTFCAAGNRTIDLILTDVIMPGMHCKQMIRNIEVYLPGVPVLYMSGYSSEMTGAHGLLAEGTHFIRKPFDLETLRQALASLLQP